MTPQEQYWKERCEAAENYISTLKDVDYKKWINIRHAEPPAPVCHPQTHNFHIARHGKCQDCGGSEWMDAPAPAQGVEEAAEAFVISMLPKIKLTDNLKQNLSHIEHLMVAAYCEGYGSRWQQGELEALRRWKAEAIEVMPDMQAIGKALDIQLGESIHDKILPGIEKLKQKAATPTIGARWVRGDYGRLYDLGKSGKRVPCYVDYDWSRDGKSVIRDIAALNPSNMEIGVRGMSYLGFIGNTKEEFISDCEKNNVEWLDESPCTCASLPTSDESVDFGK